MKSFSARELRENIARIESEALKGPVAITDAAGDGATGDGMVLMSRREYERLKTRDRWSGAAEDLPEHLLEEIARTEMDPRHDHLDRLMD